jgi:hypothetical protein
MGELPADGCARLWWRGRNFGVHRLAFRLKTGLPIAKGVKVMQRCGNRHCIARVHLYAGSQDDVTRKTRRPRGERTETTN